MEIWDILDDNRCATGRTVVRGQPMKQDEYHLVVHVWVRNSAGLYLISQRAENKTYPGLWETTGGSAVSGDDSFTTAIKETQEELGLDVSRSPGALLLQCRRQHRDYPDFLDVWLFHCDVDIRDIICQADEVSAAKWASADEIRQMIKGNLFVPAFPYIEHVFEVHGDCRKACF